MQSARDSKQPPTKQRKSRKTTTANQQNGKLNLAVQQPANEDTVAGKAYWQAQGLEWRTDPEIDKERKEHLANLIAMSEMKQEKSPFEDVVLNRADIEWLLATYMFQYDLKGLSSEWMPRVDRILDLRGANLHEADFHNLPLSHVNLGRAHLEGANLSRANLAYSDLSGAFFSTTTNLQNINLGNKDNNSCPSLVGVHWGEVDLSVVDWSKVEILGDESVANKKARNKNEPAYKVYDAYKTAVRANRQLAVALQEQGLNEEAAHFAYRAHQLQREVLRRDVINGLDVIKIEESALLGRYLFTLFLDLLAGYGYRPGRSVLWYLIIVIGFALTYHFLGGLSLYPPDAFVFSIMSFHGRGFFPSLSQETNLHNPLVMLAAAEAIVGLLIEISFIATFTQRFFGK